MAADTDLNILNLDFLGKQETIIAAPDESAIRPTRGTFVDHSGTITTANMSQLVMRERDSRVYLLFQNLSNAPMWLGFSRGAIATQPSIRIEAGERWEMKDSFVTTESVSVLCDTAGSAFVAKEAWK